MEGWIIGLFLVMLTGCVIGKVSILYALTGGLVLFLWYGKSQGKTARELAGMMLSGIRTVQNILIIFLLIGMLTALWRACGTIPVIICYASKLVRPSIFLLMAFLMNCLVSVLTGTSFGTAATMGVISMTMGRTMEIDPILTGGAIMSGIFFGDRCSPVSTSALLVAELTKTDIFTNLKSMCRTAVVPFLLTVGIYLAAGLSVSHGNAALDVEQLFAEHFHLHWLAILPAAVIFVLSVRRVNVKTAMLASILTAAALCLTLQNMTGRAVFSLLLFGFRAQDPQLVGMLNGGGILSMIRVSVIVCLSSSYAGIFEGTGLLTPVQRAIRRLGERITPFGGMVVTALVTSMVSCNQTLATILTNQLCGKKKQENLYEFAVNLEDTVIVIAPLIPWSIAGAVPLATISAPAQSLLFACFLYLLPLCGLARAVRMR